MSWIKDKDECLVNLDHIESIDVRPVDPNAEPMIHVVFATTGGVDEEGNAFGHHIFHGTEEECKLRLSRIAAKLPLVKEI